MNDFHCLAHQDGDSVVLVVRGDVDMSVSGGLWAEVERWISPGVHLVLDLSAVTFLDSMGLRVLFQAQQAAEGAEGATFAVAAPSAPVTRVLELAGVQNVITVVDAAPVVEPG